ncbi:MAG: anthranilate phosphoribosyltransferase [Candidatus Omnitrophota bacterium]
MIQEVIKQLSQNKDLTLELMQAVMEEIMTGRVDTPQIISFLTALNNKGETIEELTAAVSVMRKHVTRICTDKKVILDTCGTGADAKGTFNVSTVVAFVACGCGITVAKHGNRSISSSCGSADILEALGTNINMAKEGLERCLNEVGIAFLFAQNLHPAMKYAMPARKQMGVRTMFNILGPLTNPAGATHQLVGVYDRRWTGILAQVLGNLGTAHALVVHSQDGLDEISTGANTYISEECKGQINNYEINPGDFGFSKTGLDKLKGGTVADNVRIALDVLKGKSGPHRDMVVLNAAAAIYVADKAKSVKEAIGLACESIDSGRALAKLELLKKYSLQK